MSDWRHPDRDHPTDYADMDATLMAALLTGDRRLVEKLRESGFDFDKPHGHDKTALHWAAENNNIAAMQLLLECGASIDAVDEFHRTPLMLAAYSDQEDVAIALVHAGADPAIANRDGETPLHKAAWKGMEKLASALLATKRAPVNISSDAAIVPIHRAADKGHMAILKALLDAGADPNLKDHADRTSMHYAAGSGHGDAVVLMMLYGGRLDAQNSLDETPLALARKYDKEHLMFPVHSHIHSTRIKRAHMTRKMRGPA